MTRRSNEEQPRDVSAHLRQLSADDDFLTALSRGEDPSGGVDELADLFLQLRSEVETQMPAAPGLDAELEPQPGGLTKSAVTPPHGAPSAHRHRTSPWTAGLIGAAAATVIVAGTGAALYSATPGSPLWGPASAVFGDRAAVVELASTLDELEAANNSGNVGAARELLAQAQLLIGTLNPGAEKGRNNPTQPSVTVTERTTARATPAAPAVPATEVPAPEGRPGSATVTERETETVTVTVTSTPEPTGSGSSAAPTPTTGTTRPTGSQSPSQPEETASAPPATPEASSGDQADR